MGSWKWRFCKPNTVHTIAISLAMGEGCACGGGECTRTCVRRSSTSVLWKPKDHVVCPALHFPPYSLESLSWNPELSEQPVSTVILLSLPPHPHPHRAGVTGLLVTTPDLSYR